MTSRADLGVHPAHRRDAVRATGLLVDGEQHAAIDLEEVVDRAEERLRDLPHSGRADQLARELEDCVLASRCSVTALRAA